MRKACHVDFPGLEPPSKIESWRLKASVENLWRPQRSLGKSLARILRLTHDNAMQNLKSLDCS